MIQMPAAPLLPEIHPLSDRPPVESAVHALARLPDAAILDSALPGHPYARVTVLCVWPAATVSVPGNSAASVFPMLRGLIGPRPTASAPPTAIPFYGGWIGCLSYEAGRLLEPVGANVKCDPLLPAMRLSLYDTAAVYDHAEKQWYLTGFEWPKGIHRPRLRHRFASFQAILKQVGGAGTEENGPEAAAPAVPNMSRAAYLARVRRIKRYIEAGDVFQVNLTQRFSTETALPPEELYLRVRQATPAPFAAMLRWNDRAILSASPELFLQLRDGHVVSRPIKGTRPRGATPTADQALRRELETSPKDRAELTMITDLLRHDLGRVCAFGTVHVSDPGSIEAHPTVHHRVATVEGDLAPGRDWFDLLRATFPGGSITGAPKVRAMQIIDELEPTARGVYCGAIGWIGMDGSMTLNLAIRTLVQSGRRVYFYAGGGIVADSRPEDEYEETLTKASGIMRALGCRLRHERPRSIEAVAP